jgi:concentrative nucleoside transporter, CNT family
MIYERLLSAVGIFAFIGIAFLFSKNRKAVQLRVILWGVALQFIFALFILKTPIGEKILFTLRDGFLYLLRFTDAGSSFLFGNLYRTDPSYIHEFSTGPGPIQVWDAASGSLINLGTIFAIHVLPIIIFFASLMAILYHLGVMQKIIQAMAWVMQKTMGTSGAESLSVAFDIFVGQTEAPLVVKPYIPTMTKSELMAIMVSGFSNIAGSVMAVYARFGIDPSHLIAASVMSAPAAFVIAKTMIPETEEPVTKGTIKVKIEKETSNIIDAAASGAADGLKLALNVGAMLLAFIALVAMINAGFQGIHKFIPFFPSSMKELFSWLFAPIAFLMGVPWKDIPEFAGLLGTKISLNELIAYLDLSKLIEQGALQQRTILIATYALCGFANFSSIAIQIGGIGGMAPSRRADIAKLGLRAMFAGAMATAMTACIAGILI